jgi:hypothetical protein
VAVCDAADVGDVDEVTDEADCVEVGDVGAAGDPGEAEAIVDGDDEPMADGAAVADGAPASGVGVAVGMPAIVGAGPATPSWLMTAAPGTPSLDRGVGIAGDPSAHDPSGAGCPEGDSWLDHGVAADRSSIDRAPAGTSFHSVMGIGPEVGSKAVGRPP